VDRRRHWDGPYATFEAAREASAAASQVAKAVPTNRAYISDAVETYLAQKQNKARRTVLAYRMVLYQFVDMVKVRFLDEITVDVLRGFKRVLEKEGFAGKTIDTRLNIVYFMLKKNGVTARIPADEMPVIEEEPAMPYSEEELKKLFAAMDAEELIRYKFFLGSGCRDREVTFASWQDIDFEKKTYTVRSKPEVGFTVKNHESRTVGLPDSLIAMLRARRKQAPHDRWIFATEDGTPGNHFLRKLKKIALRAGLNCGQCRTTISKGKYHGKHKVEVSCKTDPVCKHIFLHRLRKTCATRWHESHVPIRTIQHWLGHKNLETTMLYLGVTDSDKLRDQINTAFKD